MNTMMINTADTSCPEKELVYSTKFGELRLREDRLMSFPVGILGFSQCTVFGLTRMPENPESPILLLQSVNEPGLTFLVADPAMMGLSIAGADREEAIKELGLEPANTQTLVILRLYDSGDNYYLTANLKAPIFVDSTSRVGYQYILQSKDYSTQHKI